MIRDGKIQCIRSVEIWKYFDKNRIIAKYELNTFSFLILTDWSQLICILFRANDTRTSQYLLYFIVAYFSLPYERQSDQRRWSPVFSQGKRSAREDVRARVRNQ